MFPDLHSFSWKNRKETITIHHHHHVFHKPSSCSRLILLPLRTLHLVQHCHHLPLHFLIINPWTRCYRLLSPTYPWHPTCHDSWYSCTSTESGSACNDSLVVASFNIYALGDTINEGSFSNQSFSPSKNENIILSKDETEPLGKPSNIYGKSTDSKNSNGELDTTADNIKPIKCAIKACPKFQQALRRWCAHAMAVGVSFISFAVITLSSYNTT